MLLDHAAANCPSHELFKHVLSGKSTGVFKGKILVRPDSQKTDSKQTSKTLLLSDDAIMDSMPALEIYADDVKCTHGSTTGPVDEEQVFYLRSRGVSHEFASSRSAPESKTSWPPNTACRWICASPTWVPMMKRSSTFDSGFALCRCLRFIPRLDSSPTICFAWLIAAASNLSMVNWWRRR
jgi:SUF system FeS cluster assembly, SufBD